MKALRASRGPLFVALITAFVLAVNVGAIAAFHAVFPGVDLIPDRTPQAATQGKAAKVVPVAARTAALPAQQVVQAVLAGTPKRTAGWKAAATTAAVAGAPFDFACGTPAGPAPVVASSRGWVQSNGPLPKNIKAGITVTVRAYGAGQGAVAFAQQKATINDCASAYQASRSGTGVDAMAIWSSSASTLAWRRGDVLVLLSATAAGRPGNLASVTALAAEFDTRLAAALSGVCADPNSVGADATRSPYANRAGFTGLTVSRPVALDTAALAVTAEPTSPATGAPAAQDAPVVPIPAPTKTLPDPGTLPTRPADPVTPDALPKPVSTPTAPAAPSPAPTRATVGERVDDTTGPGCGWAFTGQAKPTFDQAAATKALTDATAKAQARLQAGYTRWVAAKDAYYVAYAAYLKDVDAFTKYAAQVEKTRAAWTKVQDERDAYTQAVSEYDAALAAREKFLADQKAAQDAYTQALAACATQTGQSPASMQVKSIAYVTDTPVPSPTTTTPTPGPTATTPTPTPSPSTTTPKPTPSTSTPAPPKKPTMVCPPVRPAILDQDAPVVPTKPVPPASMPGAAQPTTAP